MKFKKLTALLLAFCMLFSLSVSAFAAEKTPTGYLTWSLDGSGTLTISGNGRIAAFTSAEDQPWHEMRESIMQRTSRNAVIFLNFIAYPSSRTAAIVKITVAALTLVTASLAETFAL